MAGAATLFLQNAATVEVGFTVRISYVLLLLALVVGAPWAWQGWRALPWWLGTSAAALLLVYVLATLFGDQAVLAGAGRAGSVRDLVYLSDLTLGLGLIGLVCGLWAAPTEPRPLVRALALGGVVAALYAIYQWPAQRFRLPLSDVVTTGDSNGFTSGNSQGVGVFGWERVRGTFLEPHFLGAYLASMAPLVLAWGWSASVRSRRIAVAGAAAMLLAMFLTASAPALLEFAVAILVAAAIGAVAAGMVRAATVLGLLAALCVLLGPLTLVYPNATALLTGRGGESMAITARFREDAWDQALVVWAARPALGYGAGQSSVRLALLQGQVDAGGLPSAQGVWTASLIDGGVVGLGCWLALVAGIITLSIRWVWWRPTIESTLVLTAVLAACFSTAVAGDRVELRVWMVFALALALASRAQRASPALAERFGGLGDPVLLTPRRR